LLKTLEEPPGHVIFIMATTELHKVPETILSRCQQFDFRTIPAQKIFNRLRLIAEAEEISISDAAMNLIVRAGEGSMRDAQSAFDQVISFAGKEIKDGDVSAALGIIGSQTLNGFVQAIADRDVKSILSLVDDLVSRGYDLRNFTREMMAHFRNLLIIQSIGFDREIVSATEAEGAELKRLSEFFSEEDLIRFFNVLTKVEYDIRTSTQERFHLELGLLKLTQMARLSSLEEILERIKRLEGSSGGSISASTPRAALSPAPARIPSPSPRPAKTESASPAAVVPKQSTKSSTPQKAPSEAPPDLSEPYEVVIEPPQKPRVNFEVERIKSLLEDRKKMRVLMAIDSAEDMSIVGDELKISFSGKGKVFAEQLRSRDNIKLLEEIGQEAAGRKLTVVIGGQGASTAETDKPKGNGSSESGKTPRERANENPVVQSFVKAFKGQIVDVKPPDDTEY
jgi:DNA polymerase-3 subunit gamma/tau